MEDMRYKLYLSSRIGSFRLEIPIVASSDIQNLLLRNSDLMMATKQNELEEAHQV